MELACVGNNKVACCPYCYKLFAVKVLNGDEENALLEIMALLEVHMRRSTDCQAKKDAQPSFAQVCEGLRPGLEKMETERQHRIDENPDNGKLGYWRVEGMRHEARTKASSAAEAIKKCSGVVSAWDLPEATFLYEELPDVF